jgi:hypothetical protein
LYPGSDIVFDVRPIVIVVALTVPIPNVPFVNVSIVCPAARLTDPPFVTSNFVAPDALASSKSPEFVLFTINAPLFPIPPLINNGACGVTIELPISTPDVALELRSSVPVPFAPNVKLVFAPVVWIVVDDPFPRLIVAPFTVRFPPSVVNPVPVVIALFVVVSNPSVPVPVMSMILEFPANVTPAPFTVRFPPSVVNPVPVVIALFVTVSKLSKL